MTHCEQEIITDGVPKATFHDDRLDMAHWFPMLEPLDIPVPETVPVELERQEDGPPEWDTAATAEKLKRFDGEAFVRSGFKSAQMHQSGSHIRGYDDIDPTITELLSQHVMMGMRIGEKLWLREWLDLDFCAYSRDPLVPEVRVFIRDGEVVCHHPRLEGFESAPGGHEHREVAEDYFESGWCGEHRDETVEDYAERVADALDGWWSVDFVMDRDGNWYCTDMALDAVYWREDGEMWSGISEHPGDCDHDVQKLASDLEPPEQREGWR